MAEITYKSDFAKEKRESACGKLIYRWLRRNFICSAVALSDPKILGKILELNCLVCIEQIFVKFVFKRG